MADVVNVPSARLERWVENFSSRHGVTRFATADDALCGSAEDGSTFEARLPLGRSYGGPPEVAAFLAATTPPPSWGVLLVRKGGYGIARLAGPDIVDSKTGQRHVQGRTKAGGQSQQRFARRRDNQARVAYEAAADHAARILSGPLSALVTGGDHAAVDQVLTDTRLRHLTSVVVGPWLAVPDPRRAVLEAGVGEALAVRVSVDNA